MRHDFLMYALRVATLAAWALAAFDLIPWGWDIPDNVATYVLTLGAVGAVAWMLHNHTHPFDEVLAAGETIGRRKAELEQRSPRVVRMAGRSRRSAADG